VSAQAVLVGRNPGSVRALAICDTAGAVDATGLHGVAQAANGQYVLYGIVPNGNTVVAITTRDGVKHTVSVASNAYEISSASGFTKLEFHNASGAQVELPISDSDA